jgi:hypothetical protein
MKNGLFMLDWGSIADAVVTAAAFAVLAAFVALVSKGNFSLFSADWGAIGMSSEALLAYLLAAVFYQLPPDQNAQRGCRHLFAPARQL